MPYFTVRTTYGHDRDKLAEVRPSHRDYLKDLVDQGAVVAAGPFVDDLGGFIVFQAPDEARVQDFLEADPYIVHGVVVDSVVREWKPVLGSWVEHG